jgi:hypothetical protein
MKGMTTILGQKWARKLGEGVPFIRSEEARHRTGRRQQRTITFTVVRGGWIQKLLNIWHLEKPMQCSGGSPVITFGLPRLALMC